MRLSFRPEMLFAKPAYGDPRSKSALIISVKQLRNRRTGELKLVSEVVGVVSRIYTFNGNSLFAFTHNDVSFSHG